MLFATMIALSAAVCASRTNPARAPAGHAMPPHWLTTTLAQPFGAQTGAAA
ncbi:MAG: hypothetical protein IT438_04815 [Phycisphaerales bacterium]|nr:hypothetical protein [Phycisphaerales bacterium]